MAANVVNLPVRPKPKKASPYTGPLQVQKLDKWAKNPPASPVKVSDGDRSGFCAQITPAGVITFFLQYRFDGKRRFYKLGRYSDVSLSEARQRAAAARKLVRDGICPQEQKEAEKEAQKAEKRRREEEPTVAEAVETYIQKHVSGLKSARAVEGYFRRDFLPCVGSLKVKEVRRRDVLDLVESKAAQAPTAARHLLVHCKGFFDWCVDREHIENSPAAAIKPKNVKAEGKRNVLRPNNRNRVLTEKEMKHFWHMDKGMRKLTHLALKLVLVTGQRPGEVAGMHRDEIQGDTWVIPAQRRMKTETAHEVPLCPLALEIIEEAQEEVARLGKRRGAEPTGFIFEAYPGSPVTVNALSKGTQRHIAADWKPHDLRRTCRTGLSELGFSDEVGEVVIGHTKRGIVGVYNHHKYTEAKREALQAWEERIKGLVS